jgi:hypothetical protein
MNNQSEKPEKLKPQDSQQKEVKTPKDDNEAVVKPEDKLYTKNDADFVNPAKRRESEEQPVHPVKTPPSE